MIFSTPLIFKNDEQVQLAGIETDSPITDFESHKLYLFERVLILIQDEGFDNSLALVENYLSIEIHDAVDEYSLTELIFQTMSMNALMIDISGNYDNTTPEELFEDFNDNDIEDSGSDLSINNINQEAEEKFNEITFPSFIELLVGYINN